MRSARDFSLDLVFPNLQRVFNKKTIFGDKLKHVIEPRVVYRYVTGIGTDFNRFIRFDESDLLSNTNEVLLSITNRVYAKRGDTVQEIFTWDADAEAILRPDFRGRAAHRRTECVRRHCRYHGYAFLVGPRSTSPVVSKLRASPVGGLGVQWQAEYDPRYGSIVDSTSRWTIAGKLLCDRRAK